MREFIDIAKTISEALWIEPTRHSIGGPVYDVRSNTELIRAIEASKYNELRGMLFRDELHVWDAYLATHSAYENCLGDYGAIRLMIFPNSLEYNSQDLNTSVEKAHRLLRNSPIMRKVFGEKLQDMRISSNEI